MDRKRYLVFVVLSFVLIAVNMIVMQFVMPRNPQVAQAGGKDGNKAAGKADPGAKKPLKPNEDKRAEAMLPGGAEAGDPVPKAAADSPQRWISLGSANPMTPYRMLVTLNSRGAAVERVELNSSRYYDVEDRSGYLGYLAPADAPKGGCVVRVVGSGTPAAAAGLRVGDVITAVDGDEIADAAALDKRLESTEPNTSVELTVTREGAPAKLTAQLSRRPLEVIRPERDSMPLDVMAAGRHDPLSLLMTVQKVNTLSLADEDLELPGVHAFDASWKVTQRAPDEATFTYALPQHHLELVKRYKLAQAPAEEQENPDFPAYHLDLTVEVRNTDKSPAEVAYRLEGPTGLPTEGYWYTTKMSRTWGSAGVRDVIARFDGSETAQINCNLIAGGDATTWNRPMLYAAVDTPYFAGALIPQKKNAKQSWFSEIRPIRVGKVPQDPSLIRLTDVSYRMLSDVTSLAPGASLEHDFQFFIGPKRLDLLANYKTAPETDGTPSGSLRDLSYYGWPVFAFFAMPMQRILHFFYSFTHNYGLAIIMLTILVRGCMFPLSRKQALGAQRMQELQPEIKRINTQFKSEPEKRTRATQELFRKHQYNPLAGCLPMFVQLPIFIGLYRSLSVDPELRQAPLITDAIRWCSNLGAPDMLWDWSAYLPPFLAGPTGYLGPYLNILPLVTISLFLVQQKMFMPPAADEQAAMQQRTMQFMTVIMGVLFFKVPSGLCIYFIASSLWGIAEKKLLPKTLPPKSADTQPLRLATEPSSGGDRRNKRRK